MGIRTMLNLNFFFQFNLGMIFLVLILYICFHCFSPSNTESYDDESSDDESDDDEVSKILSVIGQK
jgi:cbb3-type cytochrome oxidase subunit 3